MSFLTVKNLGKAYRTYRSEFLRFLGWFGFSVKPATEHWVLRHISFSLGPGEAIGIVGQNGAGKSTLLKLITGTVQPSEGSVQVAGRIAAILELGLGFNPEFTGRENAYHAAGLMGASAEEIKEAMPEIESFAEIGSYFDEPVRTYSSGMQARLAFSVATAFRPDILIVDEVLAVGDAYFIHKCTNRIKAFRESGTSLIVVAHDRAAIQSLCDRVLLLDQGQLLVEGDPAEVLDYYNALIAERESSTIQQKALDDGRIQTLSGSGEATVSEVHLRSAEDTDLDFLEVGQAVCLEVEITAHETIPELVFGYLIKDRLGHTIYGTNTYHMKIPLTNLKAGERIGIQCHFAANLGPGSYSIATALHTGYTHVAQNFEWRELAFVFQVHNPSKPLFAGVNWIQPHIEVVRGHSGKIQ